MNNFFIYQLIFIFKKFNKSQTELLEEKKFLFKLLQKY